MEHGKVLIQSNLAVAICVAEVLDKQDDLFSHNPSAKAGELVEWFFENTCFKKRTDLLNAADKIIENIDGAYYFLNAKKIWNPAINKTYRDHVDIMTNPDACVRIVIKDAQGELAEVELTAFGSLRVNCNFPSLDLIDEAGYRPSGNSL